MAMSDGKTRVHTDGTGVATRVVGKVLRSTGSVALCTKDRQIIHRERRIEQYILSW